MITVSDILALPSFEAVELVSPCREAGLREVKNVGIVDCPPDYNEYSVYLPGELILTNLGFAYGNPELAERSLLALIKRNVSAIAVKRVYGAPVSDRVRAASTAAGVPVYQYDGAYHEEVAYESLALIKRDRDDADHAQAIEGLLDHYDGDAVRKSLFGLTGATGAAIQCFAFAPRSRDALSLYAARDSIMDALVDVRSDQPVIDTVGACRYHDLMLAFVCYSEMQTRCVDEARVRCECLFAREGTVLCGEGQVVPLREGDLTIRQAMSALGHADMDSNRVVRWQGTGLVAFADAACQDRLFMSASTRYHEALRDYDAQHGSELLRTAESLYRNAGDIRATADELYQHPNTIRYRIKKMKKLMGIEDETDAYFTNLLLLVFLPTLGRRLVAR